MISQNVVVGQAAVLLLIYSQGRCTEIIVNPSKHLKNLINSLDSPDDVTPPPQHREIIAVVRWQLTVGSRGTSLLPRNLIHGPDEIKSWTTSHGGWWFGDRQQWWCLLNRVE